MVEAMDTETRPRRYPRSRTCPVAIVQKEVEPRIEVLWLCLTVWCLLVRAQLRTCLRSSGRRARLQTRSSRTG